MKKIFVLFTTFVFMFCFGLSTASAMGVGFSGSTGGSTVDWTSDVPSAFSTDSQIKGFGFAMDTNLARERMFNYRIELAKSDLTLKNFEGTGSNFELDGIVLTNNFGFGSRLSPLAKLWFGPELKFLWMDGALTSNPAFDMDLFGAGVGAAVGININLPNRITLAAKLAYVMMDYAGDADHPTAGWTTYDGEEDLTYLTFTFFFRSSGDQ